MPIPKVIHFIWAGGERLLPEENAARINAWTARQLEFVGNLLLFWSFNQKIVGIVQGLTPSSKVGAFLISSI